jgi:hypothetical protein
MNLHPLFLLGNEASVDIVVSRLKCWKITYSTHKDLGRGHMKAYDGTLELRKKDNFLILNISKGHKIGCRFMKPKDNFSIGWKINFPLHAV